MCHLLPLCPVKQQNLCRIQEVRMNIISILKSKG